MKKSAIILAGLLSLLGFANVSRADTIVSVTETHYDSNLRPDCIAVRMNPATFADAPSNACTPKTSIGSSGPDRITQTVYDAAGQVKAVYEAVGTSSIIQYAYYNYTPNGLKASEIDANHNKTSFTYDGFDRLSKIQYPNTTVGNETSSTTDYESFGYDANGNRTSWRRRDGNTIAYSFDALNRQTYEGGDAVADMRTAYDLQGHVLSKHFTSGDIGVDYTYDGLGRVLSTTDMNGRMVRYGYNAASVRTGMIYPDGKNLIYALDYQNRMGNIHWTDGTVMVWQGYNNLGQRTALDRGAVSGSGGSTDYVHDNLGRLTSVTNDLDGTGTAHDITWTFAYNPASQVSSWSASTAAYDYSELATSTVAKTYDGLNRDAAIAAVSGGYDAKGNVTKDATRVMTYDIYNRLLTVAATTTPTTPYLTLTYDTEGRLAYVTSTAGKTEFLYDGTNLIGEYTHVGTSSTVHTSDTMTARYVHGTGVDEPLVWYPGSAITSPRFLFANYQGSVIAYTNTSGAFSESYAYDPYGVPVNSTGGTYWFGSRFRYTGQIALPEAYLYYYKARVYDPGAGRFLQTDPVGSKDDLDLYAYVGGDPINGTDPTGTQDCRACENALYGSIQDQNVEASMKDANQRSNREIGPYAAGLTAAPLGALAATEGPAAIYLAASNPGNQLTVAGVLGAIRSFFTGENPGAGALAREASAFSAAASVETKGLSLAGRAVSKHPEYFGYSSTELLQKANPGTAGLNKLGAELVDDTLKNGTRTSGAGGRYPDGWVTYTLPDGRAASWQSSGQFIGFRGPR